MVYFRPSSNVSSINTIRLTCDTFQSNSCLIWATIKYHQFPKVLPKMNNNISKNNGGTILNCLDFFFICLHTHNGRGRHFFLPTAFIFIFYTNVNDDNRNRPSSDTHVSHDSFLFINIFTILSASRSGEVTRNERNVEILL